MLTVNLAFYAQAILFREKIKGLDEKKINP